MSDATIATNVQRGEYLGPVMEAIFNTLWVDKYMIDAKETFGYKGENKIMIPLQTRRPQTVSAGLTNDTEPTTITGGYYPTMPYDYLRAYNIFIEINQSLKQLFTNGMPNAAGINFLEREVSGAGQTVALDMQWFLMNGGATGALATVASANNTSKVVVVDSNRGLEEGMVLDAWNSAGTATTATDITVELKDYDGEISITMGSGDTLSGMGAGNILYKADLHSSAVAAIVPNGFMDLVKDSGTIHNTNVATNTWFGSFVLGNGGSNRDFTLALLQQAFNRVRNIGVDTPNMGLMESDVYDALYERLRDENVPTQLMPAKEGVPAHIEFSFHGVPAKMYSIPVFTPNTAMFLNLANFVKYHKGNGEWLKWGELSNSKGSMLFKRSGSLKEAAVHRIYRQIINTKPRAAVRIDDLNGLSEES